jgi:HPt (histidine-containing phosphotransfer) domain-containing protein
MLLQSNDYQGLGQQAHRLAGAAHLFNCKPLADAAIALERAMKNAEYAVTESAVKGVFKQIKSCLADGVR